LIFGAHAADGARTLAERAAYWQGRGAAVEMLDKAASEMAIGSSFYATALLDHRGVHLNPFTYARGLAAAAVTAGARIAEAAPVNAIDRADGMWRLTSGPHTVTADAVIIATNAYTGSLWPGLAEAVLPLRGHGVISAPLSDNLRRAILPGGQALTDTRRLFSGVRIRADGRLQASLDGPAFGAEATPDLRKLDARISRLFPFLGRLNWEENWSGFIAMTPDQFPRVHVLGRDLYAALGYSGRGIAAATLIGAELAARVRGVADADLVFPASQIRPIPLRRFVHIPVWALMNWWRFRDAFDDARQRRG
jgi:glycine/D-amino acid oxidase-like deaminating enzyme